MLSRGCGGTPTHANSVEIKQRLLEHVDVNISAVIQGNNYKDTHYSKYYLRTVYSCPNERQGYISYVYTFDVSKNETKELSRSRPMLLTLE